MPGKRTVIRRAEPGDLEVVETIVAEAYAIYVARIGKKPGPMLDDYAHRIASGQCHVAEIDGRIVGILVVEHRDDYLLLDNVAVAAGAQGIGIGRDLIDFAEREAASLGLPRVRLYTHVMMTENLTFYPRLGYRETERITEEGFDRVYFEKPVL